MTEPQPDRSSGAIWLDGCAWPTVLVVEDTLVNQVVAETMLARCGYRAHIAENGLDALDALSQGAFAAVLMDCQMPALGGYETTQEIRRRENGGPRIAIIAMTANAMRGERERCLAAGMDDYFAKPLHKALLQAALARWACPTPGFTTAPAAPGAPAGDARGILDDAVVDELEQLDATLLPSLTGLYFDEVGGQLAALQDAIAGGEMVAVAELAHELRGSSCALGAARVAEILTDLEASAREGDLSGADELIARLHRRLDETRSALAIRLAKLPALG